MARKGRPPRYRRDIGAEVLAMRRQSPPVPWGLIERKYDFSRTWLWEKMREAEAREVARRATGAKLLSKHIPAGQGARLLG